MCFSCRELAYRYDRHLYIFIENTVREFYSFTVFTVFHSYNSLERNLEVTVFGCLVEASKYAVYIMTEKYKQNKYRSIHGMCLPYANRKAHRSLINTRFNKVIYRSTIYNNFIIILL